jgi:hypothetical protein
MSSRRSSRRGSASTSARLTPYSCAHAHCHIRRQLQAHAVQLHACARIGPSGHRLETNDVRLHACARTMDYYKQHCLSTSARLTPYSCAHAQVGPKQALATWCLIAEKPRSKLTRPSSLGVISQDKRRPMASARKELAPCRFAGAHCHRNAPAGNAALLVLRVRVTLLHASFAWSRVSHCCTESIALALGK